MMPTLGGGFHLVLISVLYFTISVAGQDANITIPLNKTLTYENRELYGTYLMLNGLSNVHVNFSNVNNTLDFIVFQVHSHMFNITLCMNNEKPYINGTNLGFVSFSQENLTFQIYNYHKNVTVRVFISVHGYKDIDPIPGACNMEFPEPEIYPFLYTQTLSDYILVEAAAPSGEGDRNCINPLTANMTFYMMYLPEINFYSEPYFIGLRRMMTLEGIKKYGTEVPFSTLPLARRMLSAYPGTGAIYAVVAWSQTTQDKYNFTAYSVYVPSYSYGCSDIADDGCKMIDDWLSQILCVALMFVGVFICFFGHRFFKTEMFFAGFFSGVIITYILIALITVIDKPALLAAAAVSGIFFGGIWWLFWWLYGIPVLAVLLPTLNLGFLLASIFYNILPGPIPYLKWDFNFWSVFILIMMLTSLVLVSVSYAANIICCAVLGSYATVLSIDYYTGSSLKFIIINVIRRAIVPRFNTAFLARPNEQWRDVGVTFTWMLLATLGFVFQHWHNRGRPPFPPPPRVVRPSMAEPAVSSYGTIASYLRRPRNQQTIGDNDSRTPVVSRIYNERTGLLE